MLNIKLNSTINRGKNSVQVMLGLTNDTIEVFDRTPPTTLIPGVNVVGIAGLLIRQTFRRPKYSAFGLFDVSTSLLQTYQGSDFIIVVPWFIRDHWDSPNMAWSWIIGIPIYSTLPGRRHNSHYSSFWLFRTQDCSRSSKQVGSKWILKYWWTMDSSSRYLWNLFRKLDYESSSRCVYHELARRRLNTYLCIFYDRQGKKQYLLWG